MFTKKDVAHLGQSASLTTRKWHLQTTQSSTIVGSPKPSWPSDPSVPQPPIVNISWDLGLWYSQNVSSSVLVHAFPIHLMPSTWTRPRLPRLVMRIGKYPAYRSKKSLSFPGTRLFTKHRSACSNCKQQHSPTPSFDLPYSTYPTVQLIWKTPKHFLVPQLVITLTSCITCSPLSHHVRWAWLIRNLCTSFRGMARPHATTSSLSMSLISPTCVSW